MGMHDKDWINSLLLLEKMLMQTRHKARKDGMSGRTKQRITHYEPIERKEKPAQMGQLRGAWQSNQVGNQRQGAQTRRSTCQALLLSATMSGQNVRANTLSEIWSFPEAKWQYARSTVLQACGTLLLPSVCTGMCICEASQFQIQWLLTAKRTRRYEERHHLSWAIKQKAHDSSVSFVFLTSRSIVSNRLTTSSCDLKVRLCSTSCSAANDNAIKKDQDTNAGSWIYSRLHQLPVQLFGRQSVRSLSLSFSSCFLLADKNRKEGYEILCQFVPLSFSSFLFLSLWFLWSCVPHLCGGCECLLIGTQNEKIRLCWGRKIEIHLLRTSWVKQKRKRIEEDEKWG